jgi:hypothetical protein
MTGVQPLSMQEFLSKEPLRLGVLHDAVLEFLPGRADVAVTGADAVNAYVREVRICEDVDVLALRGAELAAELGAYLGQRFKIDSRVRKAPGGRRYRIDHVTACRERHLVDVWPVSQLPPVRSIHGFCVVTPEELIAGKVRAFHSRRGRPKSGIDMRDLAVLLLQFPELKTETGPVRERLDAAGAGADVLEAWREIVAQEIVAEDDEDEFR